MKNYFLIFLSAISLLINCHIRHNLEFIFNQKPIQQLNVSKTTTRSVSAAETATCQELINNNERISKITSAKPLFVPVNLFRPCFSDKCTYTKVITAKLDNDQFVPTENKRYLYFRQLKIAVPAALA